LRRNTHAGKAARYDLGRPAYPDAFFDFLGPAPVIADIGAGTGKVTQGFLEHGSRVYAVEPDEDMRRILLERTGSYGNCTVLGNYAEDTGIPTGTIDLIFCGNSYYWFDRARAIPEFKRILKPSAGVNVVLAWLGGSPRKSDKLYEALAAYRKPMDGRHDESPPFREGAFEMRGFSFTLHRDWDGFLSGMLSASFSPNPGEDDFEGYCEIIKQHFERYSKNQKLETKFKLTCMTGNANDLI